MQTLSHPEGPRGQKSCARSSLCVVSLPPLRNPSSLSPFHGWENSGFNDLSEDAQLARDKSREWRAGQLSLLLPSVISQLQGECVRSNWRVIRTQWKVAAVSNGSIPRGCVPPPWCWSRELSPREGRARARLVFHHPKSSPRGSPCSALVGYQG